MPLRLDQKTRLIAAVPLFQALEPQAVHVLAFSAQEKSIGKGETLFARGDASDGGCIVVSGLLRLDPARGKEALRDFGAGTLIGETALVSETKRPATATALEAVTLLLLPRELMHHLFEAHPASAAQVRAIVARRLGETRDAMLSVIG